MGFAYCKHRPQAFTKSNIMLMTPQKYLAAKKKAREEKMAVHGEPCIGVCQHYRANGIDDPFKEVSS